jgi:hypothetical protein
MIKGPFPQSHGLFNMNCLTTEFQVVRSGISSEVKSALKKGAPVFILYILVITLLNLPTSLSVKGI